MSLIKYCYFLIFIVLFVACSPSAKTTVKAPAVSKTEKGKRELTEEEQINLRYLFVNANKEKILGNKDKAADLFAQCIRIDGSNHAAMYELALIYAEQKKINDALFFARSAYQLDATNTWYRLFLAELLMAAKKGSEGEAMYAALFKDYPRNIDYAFKYASALLYNGKIVEAIKVYDKVEEEIGINADLSIEKERLWLRLGKVDKAAVEIEKLIAKEPKELKNYSLLVELYQINLMPEKALETIKRMQTVDETSPYVYLAYAEYYRSNNQKEKSFEQLKLAFASKELEQELKIKIISSYLPLVQGNPEMLEQALTLSGIMAESNGSDAIALAIYGDFLMVAEKYNAAIDQYRASLAIDNKNIIVWQQLLISQSQISDFKGMLKDSEEALSLYPDQSVLYLFNGIALTAEDRSEEAVKSLLAGSKLVVDNDLQLKEFYTRLADNYNTLKNYKESDAYFEKALKLDPQDPLILNNYAYYLSERKENLEKAETMSKLSNEIRPGQPSYEDTYGWILFMMGKYVDAKTWLQKAIDNGGSTNGTILEHMGDTLYKLGDSSGALDFWSRAKAAGDTSDLIDIKIRDKKLNE
ncbi:MAG: tetratricopeptide repeat protein [Bacteroidota bacterium]|nr:tetratricopeptide repeat protein [Bacteroidota bacterium]